MYTNEELIYHRGRHGYIKDLNKDLKENSLDAFSAAIRMGATMIEFDARNSPCTPGMAVIAHDPLQIESTRLTVWKALSFIRGRCKVNIEIKDPSIADEIICRIDHMMTTGLWTLDQFIISSFHHETACRVKAMRPPLAVGVIVDGVPCLSYLDTLYDRKINNLHMECMNADMDMQNGGRFMSRAKDLGMHIWVWTVNDLDTATRVKSWGAERIFTDKPELFQ